MSQLLENRYQILRELSEGGFGKTFIAEDTQMPSRRRCVIKQLKPINQGSNIYELIKERFQREAVILEDLGNHSSQIPTLYAHFSSEDKFYLVQEYIEGETLAQRVQKQGKLSESAVREILIKLLPVLEYVHSKRIVHRDIKPENIILRSGDDTPVLIDFGAVREIMGTVMTSSGNSTGSIVIGTPGYMPSEQMIGRPIFASDLYALSLTAIYALTGKIPSELENDPLTGNLAWLEEANTVSPTLATILDKGIETYARDRFATAREMLQALQGQVQTMEVTMPPMVASTIMSAPPTVVNSEFLTQAIPSENNNSIISTPTKTGANNNILMAGIIGLVLLIGFGSLGYFQFQQQQNYQAQMAQLEEERKKAEEEKLKQQQELQQRLEEEKKLREQTEIKRQQEEARRKAAEEEARRKQQTIVINQPAQNSNSNNQASNTNGSIGGKPGYKNIRSGPGTNYGVVASAATGSRIAIINRNYDSGGYLWYQVYHPSSSSTGWIAAQLVNID